MAETNRHYYCCGHITCRHATRYVTSHKVANISLAQLVAEGKEIIERENIPPSKYFDPDLWAASVAVSRYGEAHREWLEANEDEHMRVIRIQAQENVRLLKASLEAKRIN